MVYVHINISITLRCWCVKTTYMVGNTLVNHLVLMIWLFSLLEVLADQISDDDDICYMLYAQANILVD